MPALQYISNCTCLLLLQTLYNLMSMALDLFCLIVLLTMPAAVALLVFIVVAGCGWPILASVACSAMASCPLRKRASSSASTANAINCLILLQTMCMAPLKGGGVLCGSLLVCVDSVAEKKETACLAASLWHCQVGGIQVSVQYHVACCVSDSCVWVCVHIVE